MSLSRLYKFVLILDFDETLAISDKDAKGEYIIQKDGSIKATILDKTRLQCIVALAILFQIPIHIVTARADIPGDRKVIEEIISSVGGFHSGAGGFKQENIHFCSTKEEGAWKLIYSKAEVIENIYLKMYSYLPREALLFIDDMLKYIEGVKKSGFLTFQADPESKEHFDLIKEFILNEGRHYTYQPMLFKNILSTIPSEDHELPCGASKELLDEGLEVLKKI